MSFPYGTVQRKSGGKFMLRPVSAVFKFLSNAEFERLASGEKLTYLSDAMEELQRARVAQQDLGWNNPFIQMQQQQQPKSQPDSDPSD